MIRRDVFVVLAAAMAVGFLNTPSFADDFRAGVSVVDITPPVPYRMSGYFSERLSTGVLDPLHAKAIVLSQGDVRFALVSCDLIGIALHVSETARKQAAEKTGIPFENISIFATHSHTGPLYDGALRQHFHDLAVKEHGSDPHEKTDYPAFLIQQLVKAVEQANKQANLTQISVGVVEQTPTISFNRRFHMKNGPVRFNPGPLNPEIIRAAGPIDPQVGVLTFANGDKPLASLTVFALHLDTLGGTQYSADYPFYLEKRLKQRFGQEFVSAFGAGTCGDINHIDVTTRERRKTDEIGNLLADNVEKAISGAVALKPSLAVLSERVNAPLQQYSDAEIAEASKMMKDVANAGVPFLERVRATTIMSLKLRNAETAPVEVQAFRLSDDVALVTLPGEVFVDFGLAIKKASPFKHTLIVELANDAPGYIPTRKAFEEGSYETVNSRLRPGGGEDMMATAIRLLRTLKQ